MSRRYYTVKGGLVLVSMAMLACNSKIYLAFCADSFMAQSMSDYGLFVVDDGSNSRVNEESTWQR